MSMSDAPQRYPLAWPAHKPRRHPNRRERGAFRSGNARVTIAEAVNRLENEVARLGGTYPLLSSNVELRMDGRPRVDQPYPVDPGVCLYFQIKGAPYAMACDTYTEVAQNIAAIANHIEATRRIERYGVATAAETLQAFLALPPPLVTPAPARPWPEVFGVIREHATAEAIGALYRVKAKAAADSPAALTELNLARDAAMKELTRC